ncbi:putative immunity protein [Solicola sp. PLA-1-18]|uniref:putative immunity protein n=1 Tax=Solicola sp. PLA-1-18 TaxID=3380532 RepID=UPI003B7D06F1
MCDGIELDLDEIREVAAFATVCAREVLGLFEADRPDDARPRAAVDAASAFAMGGARTIPLRQAATAANRAARETTTPAAREAALSAGHAAASAYLHPLARAHQVRHVLGSAVHAARAVELAAGDDPAVGLGHLDELAPNASPVVVDVLRRYPVAPAGAGRVAELLRHIDAALRG